tara:strand:- start:87 stop:479 length:393 start_codon:yes stop_codon:yes gene_type:complete
MSEYMLDDYNLINDINPFVVKDFSLPGTRSEPYGFAPHKEAPEDDAQWDTPYESPGCSMIALGDKTVSFCNPGEPNCPMSRPLEPQQNFEPGMWTYQKKKVVKRVDGGADWTLFALVVLCVIILLSFLRR